MPNVWIDLHEFDDDDLISELEDRGYIIEHKDDKDDTEDTRLKDQLHEVLQSWYIDKPEVFEKNMRIFYDRWHLELKNG